MNPSKTKLQNLKKKLTDLTQQELNIKSEMRKLYDLLVAEVGEDIIARRYIAQAYYQIQKERNFKLREDSMQPHPFFGMTEDGEDEDIV